MDSKKLKYSLIVLALGLVAGFAVTFWMVPDNKFIPENDKAGLDTSLLGEQYKYNLDELKKIDPKLILYKELPGFKTGFDETTGIVIDQNDEIYICGDQGVNTFNINGVLIKNILTSMGKITAVAGNYKGQIVAASRNKLVIGDVGSLLSFGKKGNGQGEYEYITSLKKIGDTLFIADAGNRKVSVYDLRGKDIREFGKKDAAKGIKGFIIPSPHMDLDVDKDGNLWVANTGMQRLEKYSQKGVFLNSWGQSGTKLENFIGCCNPANFAIMSDGSFITAEKGLPRIKQYDKTGKFIGVVAPPSAFNEKCINMAVAVDSKGKVYALDSVEKKVRIFQKK
jgi:hypothetical protein